MTTRKRGKKRKIKAKERIKSNKKRFGLLVFLKGLRDGYSFSEAEREQADEMTEKKKINILEV